MTRPRPVTGRSKNADLGQRGKLPARRRSLPINAATHTLANLTDQCQTTWPRIIRTAQARSATGFHIDQTIRHKTTFTLQFRPMETDAKACATGATTQTRIGFRHTPSLHALTRPSVLRHNLWPRKIAILLGTDMIQLRTMQPADLPATLAIQAASHPAHLQESATTLAAKLKLSPQTCWLAEIGGEIQAYLFAHPWTAARPPALDARLDALPVNAELLFLHDLAVHPQAQGQGLAHRLWLMAKAHAQAHAYKEIQLIALASACEFWRKQGFTEIKTNQAQQTKLTRYGHNTLLMRHAI